jgi:hypothetical protein
MMIARSAEAAALFEQRLFAPDIARSNPGEPPSGAGERFESWLWDVLAYFLRRRFRTRRRAADHPTRTTAASGILRSLARMHRDRLAP